MRFAPHWASASASSIALSVCSTDSRTNSQGQRALWVKWAGAVSRFVGESIVLGHKSLHERILHAEDR